MRSYGRMIRNRKSKKGLESYPLQSSFQRWKGSVPEPLVGHDPGVFDDLAHGTEIV